MAGKIVFDNPRFDGTSYGIQKVLIEEYLEYCGYDVEKDYKNPYTPPTNGSSTPEEIKEHEANNKVKYILKNSLVHSELIKVQNLKKAKFGMLYKERMMVMKQLKRQSYRIW